jgi:hypothetical protein
MQQIYSIIMVIRRALGKLQGSSQKCMSHEDSTFTKDAIAVQCADYQAFTPPPPNYLIIKQLRAFSQLSIKEGERVFIKQVML